MTAPRRRTLLVAALAILALPQPAAAAPPPAPPDPSCSPGPSACSAWHTGDVTVTWSGPPGGVTASGCGPTTISSDTRGTPVSCTWSNGDGSRTTTATVRRDATQPSASAHPERGPDANGWYNHPLSFTFTGSDATSGLAGCTSSATYGGPDSSHARVQGECKDQAGNWSNPYAVFKYDATAPRLTVKAEPRARGVQLVWVASTDSVSFEVVRQPGLQSAAPSTVYRGPGLSFTDHRVRRGVKYRYKIIALDEAGNAGTTIVVAAPGTSKVTHASTRPKVKSPASRPALARPAEGARLAHPPRLTWRAVPQASYYNVQLFRNGKKILSAWPSEPTLRLQKTWTYRGRRYALAPGRYRWYVWPGFGPRSSHRYGKLLGSRNFVVIR